jgi:hypothetical protein
LFHQSFYQKAVKVIIFGKSSQLGAPLDVRARVRTTKDRPEVENHVGVQDRVMLCFVILTGRLNKSSSVGRGAAVDQR